MIIDLKKFMKEEKPRWAELEKLLDRMESNPDDKLDLATVQRFHYLYQRASSDLAKLSTFSFDRETKRHLESLVARSFGEIHETREKAHRLSPINWFFVTLPQTFRRQIKAFWVSLLITCLGVGLGTIAIMVDYDSKSVIMPFSHLQGAPSERVAKEETSVPDDKMPGGMATFSSYLMTHNIKVSIYTMALGMTYGIGTILMLFYNGIILGAVGADYILDGQAVFLFGWLLPHGSVEIPSILLAGQAGFMLAGALIGWKNKALTVRGRMREISSDLVTIVIGLAIFLVWAGIIESFFSQFHAPVLPYSLKIALGSIQLLLLILFLTFSGREKKTKEA